MAETLAITSAAALSPYGLETTDFVRGFVESPLLFNDEEFLSEYLKSSDPVAAALVPEYNARKRLNTRATGNFDRLTLHLCVATEMLHEAMGFEDIEQRRQVVDDERVSLVLGSSGPIQSILEYDLRAVEDPRFVQPGRFPNVVFNVPASYAAIRRSVRGSCITLTNGDTSAVEAFGIATKQLDSGRVDLCIVGGAEEVTPAYAAFVRALSLRRSRPVPPVSEGAYLLSVEPVAKSKARGGIELAHLHGVASVFCPDIKQGLQECLNRLTNSTGIDLADVKWTCSDAPADPNALGLENRRKISLEKRLGYLGAMYAAAGVIAVLCTPEVAEGDLVLLLSASHEGACGAVLLEKRHPLKQE